MPSSYIEAKAAPHSVLLNDRLEQPPGSCQWNDWNILEREKKWWMDRKEGVYKEKATNGENNPSERVHVIYTAESVSCVTVAV